MRRDSACGHALRAIFFGPRTIALDSFFYGKLGYRDFQRPLFLSSLWSSSNVAPRSVGMFQGSLKWQRSVSFSCDIEEARDPTFFSYFLPKKTVPWMDVEITSTALELLWLSGFRSSRDLSPPRPSLVPSRVGDRVFLSTLRSRFSQMSPISVSVPRFLCPLGPPLLSFSLSLFVALCAHLSIVHIVTRWHPPFPHCFGALFDGGSLARPSSSADGDSLFPRCCASVRLFVLLP